MRLKKLLNSFWFKFPMFVLLFGSVWSYWYFSSSLLKLGTLVIMLTSAELVAPLYVSNGVKNLLDGFNFRKRAEKQYIPDEFRDLAQRMEVKFSKISCIPGLNNAFVRKNEVYIGTDLIFKQKKDSILAVTSHEFGHITGKHQMKMALIAGTLTLMLFPFFSLPTAMYLLATISFLIICMVPINWHFELKADETAIDYVGAKAMKEALLTLAIGRSLNEASFSHPPAKYRIERIERYMQRKYGSKGSN